MRRMILITLMGAALLGFHTLTLAQRSRAGLGSHATSHVQSSFSTAQPMGRVKGRVLDGSGATIILEARKTKYIVSADSTGQYEIDVPIGLYRISAEVPDYFPYRRAAFRVLPNATIIINITPPVQVIGIMTVLDSKAGKIRDVNKTVPMPKYDSFLPVTNKLLDLLIRYGKRLKHGDTVKYNEVMASYDIFTIYADSLSFNPKVSRLEAEGNVTVEDGKQRLHVKRAVVEFKAGEPILKLTQ